MKTRRQELTEALKHEYHTAQSLAKTVGVPIHVLLTDLEHVQKSLGKSLILFDAECETCTFKFKGRTKLTTPSRCPKCKKEWISGPILHVEMEEEREV